MKAKHVSVFNAACRGSRHAQSAHLVGVIKFQLITDQIDDLTSSDNLSSCDAYRVLPEARKESKCVYCMDVFLKKHAREPFPVYSTFVDVRKNMYRR